MAIYPPRAQFAPVAVPAALKPLHAGLAGRDQTTFRAVFVGDSIQEGEGVTLPGYRYPDRFEKMLRNTFSTVGVRGSPGSSYLPAYYLSATLTDPVQDNTTPLGGTPSWTDDQLYGFGGRTYRLAFGAALRWDNVECTGIRVHYAKGSFGTPFKVQVDGVDVPGYTAVVTNDANTLGGFVTPIIPVNPGVHSIRVQTTDNQGFISVIHGIEVFYDDETSGIKCYDAARSGAFSNYQGAEHFKSITSLGPVHAVFLGLVTNDAVLYNASISPDEYRTRMITTMNLIDAAISNDHSIIVMFVPEPNATFGSYTWQQYVEAAKAAVGSRSNAHFIDMRDYLGPSVVSDTTGLWADGVHLSRKGHNMVADGMLRSLYLSGGGALEPELPYVVVPSEAGMVAAAPTGRAYLYSRDTAGRSLIRVIDNTGLDVALQPHIGNNNVRQVVPNTGSTAATATTGIGTGFTNTATTVTNPNPASGSLRASTKRTTFTSAATAAAIISHVQSIADIWRGNAARQGGFDFKGVFSLDGTMQVGQRGFFGLTEGVAAPTNIDPLTTTALSKVGLAFALNTGNWKLIHNAAGTAPTQIDLGANFPLNVTDVLRLHLFCKPNGTTIGYRVENLSTGNFVSGTLSTNLPVNTTFMAVKMWMTNNATAAAVAFNLHRWYCESDT